MSKAPCTCSNYHPVQCAANLAGISRVEVILRDAKCYCTCHRVQNEQDGLLDEATWRAAHIVEPEKVRTR
jgi:hypothetical protein